MIDVGSYGLLDVIIVVHAYLLLKEFIILLLNGQSLSDLVAIIIFFDGASAVERVGIFFMFLYFIFESIHLDTIVSTFLLYRFLT